MSNFSKSRDEPKLLLEEEDERLEELPHRDDRELLLLEGLRSSVVLDDLEAGLLAPLRLS